MTFFYWNLLLFVENKRKVIWFLFNVIVKYIVLKCLNFEYKLIEDIIKFIII